MLPPLDVRILYALSRDDYDDNHEIPDLAPGGHDIDISTEEFHISTIRKNIVEDGYWEEGLIMLLEMWPRITPRFYRKKPLNYGDTRRPLNWWIEFHVSG